MDYTLALSYEDLPPEILDQTKLLFLDFLGVALGGRVLADSSEPVMLGVKDLVGGQRGLEQEASHRVGRSQCDLRPDHGAARF